MPALLVVQTLRHLGSMQDVSRTLRLQGSKFFLKHHFHAVKNMCWQILNGFIDWTTVYMTQSVLIPQGALSGIQPISRKCETAPVRSRLLAESVTSCPDLALTCRGPA